MPQIILVVFLSLFYLAGILIFYPYIPSINAYDAYCNGPCPHDTDAVPPPVVPCLDDQGGVGWRDPEFHSMRPYQASPCGDAPKAYYCSNDYVVVEEIRIPWSDGACDIIGTNSYVCYPPPNTFVTGPGGRPIPGYIIGGEDGRDYYITLSGAMYPIVGNTQNVRNSQTNTETIDSATRMNEYVNWYLQGMGEKAEYGAGSNLDLFKQAITYAGPTKLLEPLDFLNLRRLQIAHDAGVKPEQGVDLWEYDGLPEYLNIDPGTGQATTRQTLAHNQIVVCENGGIEFPCYSGDNSRAHRDPVRLLDWWEGKGSLPWETFLNSEGNRFANWTDTSVWSGVTPPFPWLFNQEIYYRKAYREWRGAACIIYEGNLICTNTGNLVPPICSIFAQEICTAMSPLNPILEDYCQTRAAPLLINACQEGILRMGGVINAVLKPKEFCSSTLFDLIYLVARPVGQETEVRNFCEFFVGTTLSLHPAYAAFKSNLAKLYRYIPLGNPSDKNAAHMTGGIGVRAPGLTEATILSYEIEKNPVLRYPQTQSTVEAAKFLNTMHTPKECDENGENCELIDGMGTGFEPRSCTFTEIRTNPGDSLTFNAPASYLHVDNIRTAVTQVECSNNGEISTFLNECGGRTVGLCEIQNCNTATCGICGTYPASCLTSPVCEGQVSIEIRTTPKVPFIDQLWKETVVGSNTAFRKIFPKIDPDPKVHAPVTCIAQIPGMTPVNYISADETNLRRIITAGPHTYPGNGPNSTSPGQLFFPHLGTVYEYFLKGIQTAIRPKGFGSPMVANGDEAICAETTEPGACRMWLFMRDSSGQYYYEKIIQAAQATNCSRGGTLNPAWALFIALNENAGLMTDSPAGESVDHFGCDQQGLAGYGLTIENKLECMLNTLRNDCAVGKTDYQTLCEYGYQSACSNSNADFGNMFLLGLSNDPLPPMWGTSSNTATMIAALTSNNYSSFQQFAPNFCPNSPTLILPPYE